MILSLKEIQKRYPGFELNCTLEVPEGRITGLIGANGAGKTTLFKIILQLIFADGGEAYLFDKKLSDISEEDRRRIGIVLADSTFSGFLTIADAKTVLAGFYPAFDPAAFDQKCRAFDLDQKKKINTLSTGMKAKFKVICATCVNAELLVMDEPTSGLDVIARDDVLEMLRKYMEEDERRSILISSHISSDLETLCDDFYMVHEGKIILHEDTDRLLSDYAVIKVNEEDYETLDKRYLLKRRKEAFGWSCLTNQRAYYSENCPRLVIEKSGIDELITLLVKGEAL